MVAVMLLCAFFNFARCDNKRKDVLLLAMQEIQEMNDYDNQERYHDNIRENVDD